ncbi:acyl-CoA dehydrogenase family protein [Phreatobacter oligotrophus]|uniref:Acyl-CoA dehydrogenase n=1 Tax=Phreatobacter oligotrophus TaxID=1122261 RepID=A0A2T4Z0B1_9HYPH|nr:acyl-CoA dehydrogenase family protein [Phreatobacter oligotrophus]PTM52901.1 acyl-CoA dehydrogenase [Phreatobacter oligotrophus]
MLVLNDDQVMLQDAARGFVSEKAPVAALRKIRDEKIADGFDRGLWRSMAEMGWTGVLVPEDQGGLGFGFVGAGVICEEMGRTLTASPFLSTAMMAATALSRAGSPAQKERWLPAIVAGEAVIATAVDEGRRHDPAGTAMRAERHGNGFRLSGTKAYVVDGQAADAVLVAARTAGSAGETGGFSLFLVETATRGLSAERLSTLDSRGAAELTFDGVEVTADAVVGEVDDGFPLLEIVLGAGRAGLAAELSGNAQESFDRTMAYLRERKQFGRTIGAFQALQHRAAHLFCEVEVARSAVLAALQALDADPAGASLAVSVAKSKASSVARLAAQEAVQMHGGIGMTDAIDIGLFMKRMQVASTLYGDADFHADRVARARGF